MKELQPKQYIKKEWQFSEELLKKIQGRFNSGERTVVRMPARIDLAGGWNDTPPYHFENEASVLNTSLSFGNQWMIEVEVQKAEYFSFIENNYVQTPPIDNIVVIKTLDFLGLSLPPITLTLKNSIPKGSGLGGSSLLASAVLSALVSYSLGAKFVIDNPGLIANAVLMIEQMIGSGGGWQDQIGGMMPGIKLIGTSPKTCTNYSLKYLNDLVADRLSLYSLVLNTGIRRKASNVLEPIRELYVSRNKKTLTMLSDIRGFAHKGYDDLEAADILGFSETITESWKRVVEVESASTVPLIDEIIKLCGIHLAGYKIAGAGGGGYAILIFTSEDIRNKYEMIIQDKVPSGATYRPIFGRYGLSISQKGKNYRMDRKKQI